ncbi:hypothetical protein CDD80_5277 [Ophiocordyceps camponoti-rufipedis]|uniref:Protein kinase domain-containing protein n=1 Tax=Ophiocordyceps camponoti-rufipedis TaxID=2004952 RepID=A0A2C5Y012_9HYPO|nr:hypothetical protein CDD80_5277 [Ophiocordyceps camponoti-rufipedis]
MSLRSRLRLTAQCNGRHFFYPAGEIRSIFQTEAIEIELAAVFPDWTPAKVTARAELACSDGMDGPESITRLFVILVLIHRLQDLESFIDEKIKDCHLPLWLGRGGSGLFLGPNDTGPVGSCHRWELDSIDDFNYVQKKVLAPCFQDKAAGAVTSQLIKPDVFMPWTEKEPVAEILHGNYSSVYAVKIHKDHHQFRVNGERCDKFALKVLKTRIRDQFLKELRCLNLCADRDNLVELYSAYEQGGIYSFLFPWAHGGSLLTLWDLDPETWSQSNVVNSVRWIAHQCYKLASKTGLGHIHDGRGIESTSTFDKLYGIHGDIKPANILLYRDQETVHGPGVLKISDMGFTDFHSVQSRSMQPPLRPHSPAYRAPEHGMKTIFLSRKYDIWGLGCVFSELLSWFIRGPNGVKNYSWKRRNDKYDDDRWGGDDFFRHFYNEDNLVVHADLKPSVIRWINELCNIVGTTNFLSDFLNYIKDRMLVVDCDQRATCDEVSDFLRQLYNHCLVNEQYCTSHLPFHMEDLEEQEEQQKREQQVRLKRGASDFGTNSHDPRFKRARYFRG